MLERLQGANFFLNEGAPVLGPMGQSDLSSKQQLFSLFQKEKKIVKYINIKWDFSFIFYFICMIKGLCSYEYARQSLSRPHRL